MTRVSRFRSTKRSNSVERRTPHAKHAKAAKKGAQKALPFEPAP
jgi:hypothetical protein